MSDIIVEEVRRIREELIERHGGIDGYFKYLQAQERALAARSKARRRKTARTGRRIAKASNKTFRGNRAPK